MLGPASHASGAFQTTLEVLAAGIVATLATDLWHRLLHVVIGLPPAQWGLVGRWVAWMPRGVFIHRPITATPQVQSEKRLAGSSTMPLGSSTHGFMLLSCGSGLARHRPSSQR